MLPKFMESCKTRYGGEWGCLDYAKYAGCSYPHTVEVPSSSLGPPIESSRKRNAVYVFLCFAAPVRDALSRRSFNTPGAANIDIFGVCCNMGDMEMQSSELLDVFRRNVRQRRLELNLTQTDVANRIGVDAGYISDIERGRRKPNLARLAPLAEALDTTPSALISSVVYAEV